MFERFHAGGTACRLLAAILLATLAGTASADIVNQGTYIQVRGAPTGAEMNGVRVDPDDVEMDSRVQVWFERTATLSSDLTVGHAGAGLVNGHDDLDPTVLAAGTTVDSYYVLFDPESDGGNSRIGHRRTGYELFITFSHPIVGIFLDTHAPQSIGSTDLLFQPDGVTYNAEGGWRGLELGTGSWGDRIHISDDLRTLTIKNLKTPGHEIDAFRVLIAPEPGSASLMLLGLGIAGVAAIRRRRKRKQLAAAAPTDAA